jgi:mannan polymerase II complex MNN10 subunit
MLIRSSPTALAFLNKVRAHYDQQPANNKPHEQESMKRLLHAHPQDMARVVFVPQRKLNAFPDEIHCYDDEAEPWQQGDLLLHFAGAWAHVEGEDPTGVLMKKYERFGAWDYGELPDPARP